ncbi:MAG: hypothetical protein RBG13Loki_2577 [Promethearchaeota archaeon CR_4]|nr:MAG: hypothetical protein RBG13Loki_2577 [Candidatus Lokiarchaeota archaeon CR_4]
MWKNSISSKKTLQEVKSIAFDMRVSYTLVLVITGAITALYCALLLRIWWRMGPTERKTQAFNIFILIISLGFAQYFFAGHLYNMSQRLPVLIGTIDPLIPLTLSLTVIPGAVAIFLRVIKKKTPERLEYLRAITKKHDTTPRNIIRHDWQRKISHVIQFLAIFAIDFIGFGILSSLFLKNWNPSKLRLEFWGLGTGNYIGFSWTWDGWAYRKSYISAFRLVFFEFFYCLTLILLTSELCRHSHSWRYVFDKVVSKNLRPEEQSRIAAYALFPAGYMFASIFLPYFAVVGLLAGGCLGDLAASQVGLRWGRHHFPHSRKTWEGLVAGGVVTFFASLPFIGITWALIYFVLFTIVDFCTEKPVPISDNLLLPITGIFVFNLCSSLGIAYFPLIVG